MDPKTLRLLQEVDWNTIRRDLLIYTTWLVQRYRWSPGGFDLACGYTVEDVVQEVIVKAFSGARTWDSEKGALFPWLQAQSRSLVDALAKSASHRYERRVVELDNFASPEALDPMKYLLRLEEEVRARDRVRSLYQVVENNPELQEVIVVIWGGCEPQPRYIAHELGLSVREVDNRLKRLRRYASKLA